MSAIVRQEKWIKEVVSVDTADHQHYVLDRSAKEACCVYHRVFGKWLVMHEDGPASDWLPAQTNLDDALKAIEGHTTRGRHR